MATTADQQIGRGQQFILASEPDNRPRRNLADGTIEDYRLTDTLDRHHKAARWLTGADDTAAGRELGALLIDTSQDDLSGHRVYLLTIPTAYPLSSIEPVTSEL